MKKLLIFNYFYYVNVFVFEINEFSYYEYNEVLHCAAFSASSIKKATKMLGIQSDLIDNLYQ